MFGRWKRATPQAVQRTAHIGRVHMPADNYNLTREQHARCVHWIGQLQQL